MCLTIDVRTYLYTYRYTLHVRSVSSYVHRKKYWAILQYSLKLLERRSKFKETINYKNIPKIEIQTSVKKINHIGSDSNIAPIYTSSINPYNRHRAHNFGTIYMPL